MDASAVAALVFHEPDAARIAARFADHDLIAPSLLTYEMTSICAKKMRRHPQGADAIRAALLDASRLVRDLRRVDPLDCLTIALRAASL